MKSKENAKLLENKFRMFRIFFFNKKEEEKNKLLQTSSKNFVRWRITKGLPNTLHNEVTYLHISL